MTCFNDGELMSYLDRQLAPRRMAQAGVHLSRCGRCRSRLARLQAEHDQVSALIDHYQAATIGSIRKGTESRHQLNGYLPDQRSEEMKGVGSIMRRYQGLIAAAAAVVVLAGVFSFAPVRSLAAQMLQVFRVNRVQVLHFDPADVQQLENALRANGQDVDLASFGAFNHEQLQDSVRLDAGTATVGGRQITIPGAIGSYKRTGELQLTQGEKLVITPKVAGINSFLTSLGSKSLLPASLDGKTFTAQVSGSVSAAYGQQGTGASLSLCRSLSPAVTVPPGVDIGEVREALLAVPVLPERMRNTLAGVDIYGGTLMIPDFGIDSYGGSLQEVTVNGSRGVLITPPPSGGSVHRTQKSADRAGNQDFEAHQPGGKVLIWPQGEVWNALEGDFSLDEALALAGAVR